ncbi:MAG: O-antigen ligase family protein [Candidatus Omnitrophica bacterium]|nr:O-antigen ligase family protein [Candidatus Omnitrophota bacterium]
MLLILLILIFIRPFISSLAFPSLNYIYTVCLLTFLIFYFKYRIPPLTKLLNIKYPLVLFFLAIIISILFSIDKLNSLNVLYEYITALSLFVIAISAGRQDKMRLVDTIILSGLVISLLAIYQYFFGFQGLLDYMARQKIIQPFALDYISQKRVFFPFVTPNILGGYLAMVLPLCLMSKKKILFILPIALALLLTRSIGAFFSLFLGSIIYFSLSRKIRKKEIFFLLAILLISGFILALRMNTQKQHIQPVFSTLMRLGYWEDSLKIIQAHPLSGIGLGNFNLSQSRYAHNSYLQIWAEMGILGIASLLWLIIAVIKQSLGLLKTNINKLQTVSLLSANIIFLAHNFIDFSFFLPEVVFLWWVILGAGYYGYPANEAA